LAAAAAAADADWPQVMLKIMPGCFDPRRAVFTLQSGVVPMLIPGTKDKPTLSPLTAAVSAAGERRDETFAGRVAARAHHITHTELRTVV